MLSKQTISLSAWRSLLEYKVNLGILLLLASGLISVFFGPLALAACTLFLLVLIQQSLNVFFVTTGRNQIAAYATILDRTVALLICMAFIFLPAPPNQTLNILFPFLFGPLASVIFLYLNTSQFMRPRIMRKFTLGLYAKESKWFAINSISSSLRVIDIVLLGSFSNSFQTALYSSVSKMIVPLNAAATALSSVTTPHFSKLGLNRNSIKTVRAPIFLLIFICVLALTSILFSKELVVFLLGDRYADASRVLSVLLLAGVASAVGIVLTSTLEAVGKARSSSRVSLISLGIQVTLCVILLPMFGALGAAYALATSTALAVLLLLFLAVKAFKEHKRFN